MKLHEVSDEFENRPYNTDEEEQRYLFRKQAAKCHVIDLFIGELAHKYPDWWKAQGEAFWGNIPTQEWDVSSSATFGRNSTWLLPIPASTSDAREIKQQFDAKYKAMLSAKMSFERTGARYLKFAG